MHGREGEEWKRQRHMWPVHSPAKVPTTALAAPPHPVSPPFSTTVKPDKIGHRYFLKDGRKFHVGDCALFQAGNSPPFIGIICWFTPGSADYPQLGVNWLYRPSDVKLAKGILVEAAPNEVFYSFHKDEISAASLLHPCKVAFLCKGVELPSGISSFVCWRVYDTTNKCLWWLTDKDYVDERQEEVNRLLDRTRQEMHAALQSGGRSSKQLSGHLSAQQLKPSSDSGLNSSNTLSSQVKGKKRALEKADQGSESMKRERHSKVDDGDSGSFRPDSSIKAEIGKITDKGGLMNNDAVEKLVQLMQLDRGERKIDVGGRVLLADVITATDRNDCLSRFVQLRGIPILDDWLQEAHKGKNGDGSSPRGADKSVEELLLALLRALDKLPVNLNALQACQIGKSVNHLRSHKNVEIQKKAKGLVDTWKKRVDAEMTKIEMAKLNDAKPVGSTQGVSWPGKPGFSEVSLGGNRRAASTEVIAKSSINQPSSCKSLPSKSSHGDSVAKSNSPSAGSLKLSSTLATLVTTGSKDSHIKAGGSNAAAEQPLTAVKEEKSCSSSQSQSNSQSCSNDHGKAAGSLKEDVRSSAAGSTNTSKTTGSSSRHRRSSNGYGGSGSSAVQKDVGFGKSSSSTRSNTPEKVLQAGSATGKLADTPAADNGNGHILTVKLSNPGRSPSWSASGGSLEYPSARRSRPSSPGLSVKNEHVDHKTKSKSDSCQATNISAEVKTESWQSNDMKGAVGYDHGDGSPTSLLKEEHDKNTNEVGKAVEALNPAIGLEPKSGKSLESVSITMNDLSENCTRLGPGESGGNVLALTDAGKTPKSESVSPNDSSERKTPDIETENKPKVSLEDVMTQIPGLPEHTANIDSKKQEPSAGSLETQDDVKPAGSKTSDCPVSAAASLSKNASPSVTPANEPCDGASDGLADMKEDLHVIDPANQLQRKGRASEQVSDGSPGFKRKAGGLSEGKHVDCHQEIDGPDTDHTDADSGTCARESVMETSPFVPDKKSVVTETLNALAASAEHDLAPAMTSCPDDVTGNIDDAAGRSSPTPLSQEIVDESKHEKCNDVEMKSQSEHSHDERKDHTNLAAPLQLDGACSSVHSTCNGSEEDSPNEVVRHLSLPSAGRDELPPVLTHEIGQCSTTGASKLPAGKVDEPREIAASAEAFSATATTPAPHSSAKLGFDLNEGLSTEEGSAAELVTPVLGPSSVGFLPKLPLFSALPLSTSLPIHITVAAPAKGPFVPPENLLRGKGEGGWKGSAATSAFRPAEPRKALETTLAASDALSTDADPTAAVAATKQCRPRLDIDLNVADEMTLEEDTTSQSSFQKKGGRSEALRENLDSPMRSSGGLDLDLNRMDESTDTGPPSASTSRRPDLSARSTSRGFSNGEPSAFRDFDLNNGPGIDEGVPELLPGGQQMQGGGSGGGIVFLPSLQNGGEIGSLSSWLPPGNSYPAMAMPPFLPPDQGDHPYQVIAAPGGQTMWSSGIGGGTFGGDFYRGPPVLSSSPAMSFSPPGAFSYAGFPFGTSFPLPTASFSGASASYVDSASGPPLMAVPPASAASSPYVTPFVINLPEGGAVGGGGSDSGRKWGWQGLDLNAGPGGVEIEAREGNNRSALTSRQLSVAGSQAFAEEKQVRMYQAAVSGGVLKRKEPEGGWDPDKFTYRQPPWQ